MIRGANFAISIIENKFWKVSDHIWDQLLTRGLEKDAKCFLLLSSLVLFLLPISKEASPASILGRIWCDVSSRTCLAGLSALLRTSEN